MDERQGFFSRVFGTQVRSETPTEPVPVPNLDTDPPTWDVINTGYASVDECLSIPAAYRAVTLLTTVVSQLEMKVERTLNGVTEEFASPIVVRPDGNRSQAAFFKRTVYDLATTGNAYWRILRKSDGSIAPGGMEVLSPSRIIVKYDKSGDKYYEYTDRWGNRSTLTNNKPTKAGQVEHIRLGEFDGYDLGRGPLQVCNAAFQSILAQRAYYENFLLESKRPSGIYSFNADMDAEELAQVKKQIVENRNTGQPDALPKGVTYQTVMFTAEESGLIEMQKQAVAEIGRIFGLPPHKLNAVAEGGSLDYQNLGSADVAFLRDAVEEYLTAIEDAMTNVLPNGQVAMFDTDNWLRAAVIAETNPKEADLSA